MAVLHLTQHLVSEHHQHLLNVHRPASSAVHHHVVHPGLLLKPSTSPPSSSSSSLLLQQHEQRRHLVCSASSGQHGESACAGGICATSHHQQHQQQQLQQQQHRGSNSSCGAGASRATLGATAPQQQPASLGWNTASVFFSKFTLGEQMGAGSFGTVHRAVHMQTGASYAVKVLPKHCGARGMQLDAIRREVNTWSQAMGSKYVAKLEGLFEDDKHAFIVQELCTGGTLRDHLNANGTCSEQDAASIMQGVLDLLVECHRRHICYGDLKPANLMFKQQLEQQDQKPQVRAIDFGCSHNAQGRFLTQACGSPLYMAPEVALQRYGVGVDVWSAGVLLYQMLTGRLPFWPKKTLAEVAKLPGYELVAAIRTYEVQFPRALWAGISPQAQDLVSRMLDRDPASRITAAQALQHPWLSATLGFTPTPSGDPVAAAASAAGSSSNNVVEFSRGAPRSPTLRPVPLMSPGKGSPPSSSAFASPSSNSNVNSPPPGPLSPQKSSPLRSMLSGELPPSVLMADMHRASSAVMVE